MAPQKGTGGPGQGPAPRPPGATAQEKALDLAEAFDDADRSGLERLDGHGRAEQERLRTAFYLYVDALWDHAKATARAQAADPAYSGVAAMRDLAAELLATVHEAQVSSRDETGP
jgi:hypothetical protein